MNRMEKSPTGIALLDLEPALEDFHQAVTRGLDQEQKQLPCKFFYDQRGSWLFDQICQLDEYYPTRTEIAILDSCADEIGEYSGEHPILVEYGSGSSIKVRTLIEHLQPAVYMPIDISKEHLVQAAQNFARDYPEMEVIAVCADYSADFELPVADEWQARRKTAFFPGSSLGNFTPEQARRFLLRVSSHLDPGDVFVIGLDLIKDPAVLHAAYNDARGITAEFNRNLLRRINAELGADFDPDQFAHEARYNDHLERVEMHLVSLGEQQVTLGDREYRFAPGESIHTENSHKYDADRFQALAAEAGFIARECWTDNMRLIPTGRCWLIFSCSLDPLFRGWGLLSPTGAR